MTPTWRYEPEALEEVIDAARYYEGERRGLGGEFYEAVERAMDAITEVPERATPHPYVRRELGLLRHRMRRFPYVLVFYADGDERRIVAVAHVRREPLYWIRRVAPG